MNPRLPDPRPAHMLPIPPGVQVLTDLHYVEGGMDRQCLDLYLPEFKGEPFPIVISIHGGGWTLGDKSQTSLFLSLVAKGYAGASMNYRFSQQAVFPAQLEDCKAAVRWIRANAATYHIDPDRIGLWGGSAGGHLAMLVGVTDEARQYDVGDHLEYSSRVQAVCSNYGLCDMLEAVETPGYEEQEVLIPSVTGLLGGPAHNKRELAAQASPITYLTPSAAPCLLIHGDSDEIMPVQQSIRYHEELQKVGAPSILEVVKDHGHDGPGFRSPEMLAKIAAFFDRYLKNR